LGSLSFTDALTNESLALPVLRI